MKFGLVLLLIALAGCGNIENEPCRTITSAVVGGLLPPINPVGAAVGAFVGNQTNWYFGPSPFCD